MPDKHSLKIGLDFDDTLMHTREALVSLLNKIHSTSFSPDDCTDYYLSDHWSLTEEQFNTMFNAHEELIHTQPPLDGLLETLQTWAPMATFHVVTGRPDCWLPSAIKWLERHEIQIGEIVAAKAAGGKGVASKKLGIDFFIEDHGTFAREIADAGIPVFLLDRPYNRNLTHPLIQRVTDWREIRQVASERWTLPIGRALEKGPA
jgi:uncharacterized HAD superfamily protein